MNKTVIITGAMGFIGGHTAKVFKDAGYYVVGIDKSQTVLQSAYYLDELLVNDFVDGITVGAANIHQPDAIIHCAGTSLVGPSLSDPYTYYDNNSGKTNSMLEDLHNLGGWSGKIIFSSSAATYGIPADADNITESSTQNPISPYGWSKLFCEKIIQGHCSAHGFKGIALRYFNACGCDPDGILGHVVDDTHMIPRVLSAYQNKRNFHLYGNDYNTPDGTCIRDYLHVIDIAHAHLEAVCLADRFEPGQFGAYNLGTGHGHSNQTIMQTCEEVVGEKINYEVKDRRIGDPDILVANSDLFQSETQWRPRNSDIRNIVNTTWNWQKNLPLLVD